MWLSCEEVCSTSMVDRVRGGGFVILFVDWGMIAGFDICCRCMRSKPDKMHLAERCHREDPRQQHAVSAARLCHFRC